MDNIQSNRWIERVYSFFENSRLLQCIRNGLVTIVPILLIGSFSVVLVSMPIDAYQNFISDFGGGIFRVLFEYVNKATIGVLSVYLTFAISLSFSKQFMVGRNFSYGPAITSLICFFIFSGMFDDGFNSEVLGAQGVFTAIVSALGASAIYCRIERSVRRRFRVYASGADEDFNHAMSMTVPMIVAVGVFALLNFIVVELFEVTGFQMFFSVTASKLFANMGNSLGSMLMFTVLVNLMWSFGIHGNNVLEPVCQNLFVTAMDVNQELVANGQAATEIYTKTFYDVFSLMGGCGNTISLVIAILLFSKRRANKKLAGYAAVPMLFNVNEILVFGMPIVFNPIMVIPYILTPVVLILVSTAAIQCGLVPVPYQSVTWITPAIFSGYIATGSISGSVLQIVNIIIGVLIYRPFVKMYDTEMGRDAKKRMDRLINTMNRNESEDKPIDLLSLKGSSGEVAKAIAEDMQYRLEKELPRLYYQPQFDNRGNCIGAEALLRWEHSSYGMLFPPLVVKVATEAGLLGKLEEGVFRAVINDMPTLMESLTDYSKISVNVTGITIQTEEFENFLKNLKSEYPQWTDKICIEITEQTALKFNDELSDRLTRIYQMGYSLAIDDFSMGSTSIKYLQTSVFGLLKLDGSLSKDVLINPRSKEIISSITGLTKNFGISVLAEYVENEEQRKALEDINCCLYQGYLYSPAVPIEDFNKSVQNAVKK